MNEFRSELNRVGLSVCGQILEEIEAEAGLIAGWRGETGRLSGEEDQLVDIKEEYDPQQVHSQGFGAGVIGYSRNRHFDPAPA